MAMAFVKYGNFTIMYESVSKSDYATIHRYICFCGAVRTLLFRNVTIEIYIYIYIERLTRDIIT